MPKKYSRAKYVVVFVLVQSAWLAVLGLWIARYVANHMVLKEIDQRYAIHISSGGNVAVLVIGLALITLTTAGMWILFRYLNFHFHQTRLYDNFIASTTHELKTPLASIQLYLETLNSYEDISAEQIRSFVDKMQLATTRLNKMINMVLETGKLENRHGIHNCQIVNGGKLVSGIIEELRIQYNLENDQFILQDETDSQIVIDPLAIRLVFENLIDNTVKYSQAKPQIEVTFTESEKHFYISYRDHGGSVPQGQLKKIFKKFYRISDTQNPNVKGTGLGLYLVKGIINFHGGRISAGTPDDNSGLMFKIELPRYPRHRKKFLDKLIKS